MPIRYAAVFEGERKVAEYPVGSYPSLSDICQRLATKEARSNKYSRAKLTDDQQGVDVNYVSTGRNVLVVCVSTQDVAVRQSFDMLSRVEAKCRGASQDWANPKETLKREIEYANDPKNDAAKAVMGQISEIQDIMMENMDKMLERQDKLEGMVQKSENLVQEGQQFRKRGRDLKRKMCCQEAKMTAMMVAVVIFAVVIILLIACKPNFSDCS